MKQKLTDWNWWLRGLIGAVIGGAANAITIMVVDPTGFNFTTGGKKLCTFTAVSAIVSAALYLKQQPVPPEVVQEVDTQIINKPTEPKPPTP